MTRSVSSPGTIRPRGRTERTRQAVLAAVRQHLVADGLAGLTIERVAETAGVARSTIYRRWRDRSGLLGELLRDLVAVRIPLADTGSVDEDLARLAAGIAAVFDHPTLWPMLQGLIADAVHDPDTERVLREFFGTRNEQAAVAVRRGIERGELPPGTDPVEVIRMLGAPFYYRALVTREPLDPDLAARAAAAALAAARTGALPASGEGAD